MNHFLNLNQTIKAAVKLLPWKYPSGSIYPHHSFCIWWLKATLFWITEEKNRRKEKRRKEEKNNNSQTKNLGGTMTTTVGFHNRTVPHYLVFFPQRSSKKCDLWGVQEKTEQFMWKQAKEQQIFFFLSNTFIHLFLSTGIYRFKLQVHFPLTKWIIT